MRIGIAGPLATSDIEHLLDGDTSDLPREMKGATLLVSLIEALIRDSHEVVAFTTDPALLPRRKNRVTAHGPNLTVHYVPRRRHSLRFDRGAIGRMLDFFALERGALTDAMRDDRPDIIHAHWSYEFAAAALDSGVPSLITCHDSPRAILIIQRDLYRLGRYLMARSVLRRARHLTVVSPYLVHDLRKLTTVPLNVVPNPIPDWLVQMRSRRDLRDFRMHPPRIAMLLNGWSSRKNPEPAMQALDEVRAVYPGASMHLYGPDFGPNERAQHWAKRYNRETGFIFHGWKPYTETMRSLAVMDLLVHPAIEESFGMTIAEAMALGIPVVAGQGSGAVPWVLGEHAGGGVLVDVRSSNKIAEGIINILADPTLWIRFARQGRERVQTLFSAAAVTRSYLDLYRNVLRDCGVEPPNSAQVVSA